MDMLSKIIMRGLNIHFGLRVDAITTDMSLNFAATISGWFMRKVLCNFRRILLMLLMKFWQWANNPQTPLRTLILQGLQGADPSAEAVFEEKSVFSWMDMS